MSVCPRAVAIPLLFLLLGGVNRAQNGDRPGERQPPLPESVVVPPAPPLTVEEALASFQYDPALQLRCVASEPLVVDPVDIAFDGDGRLWVVEMRGYMPNIDGEGEGEPTGCITVLTDTDGDGDFDERVDFARGLVLPRGVLPYRDGALVLAPPELRFYSDTDGDGEADSYSVLERGLGGIHSPEHAFNAPRWTLDNWIQLSNHRLRYREADDGWRREVTNGGGQWGLSFDATGRAFFNTNSDGLRGDAYSSHYAVRNPNFGVARGVNERWASDQAVWPIRMTPGVNRGYRAGTLREDYTLARFTGACGPLVYLGDALPEEFRGDAFVAEPCGNLVKRYELRERGYGGLEAGAAYAGREFLASTDERFRPVNLVDGPDGGLYVVDMYRGVIQHRLFVTSWLREQVEERGLERPLGLGRIWRLGPRDEERRAPRPMSSMSWTDLVGELSHSNGWRRITAQRLIVEEGRGDSNALDLCRSAALEAKAPQGRAHALYALQGLGALDDEVVQAGLADPDSNVRLAALRCAEGALSLDSGEVLAGVARIARSDDERLAHQALLSLGEARTPAADALLIELATLDASNAMRRDAWLSGLRGRELEALSAFSADARWAAASPGRYELLSALGRCVVREGRSDRIEELLGLVVEALDEVPWHADALAEGMLAGRPVGPGGEPGWIRVSSQPSSMAALTHGVRGVHAARFGALASCIAWPGAEGAESQTVRPLTDEERARFERGRRIYADVCSACHQPSGLGEEGKAPPLRHSPWLLGSKKRPIRVLLGGLTGPIEIAGRVWDLEMPVYAEGPEEVAAVLTYIRREWGHGAEPITPAEVQEVVEEVAARASPWTAAELEALDAAEKR